MAEARRAWVMDVGDGVAVAAGTAHVVEYLLAADPMPVPRAPEHCAGLIVWRERLIPVIDLARLLTGRDNAPGPHRRAVILAYQQAAGRPLQYGALFVTAAPTQTSVSDDMACALPDTQPALAHIARACFTHQDQAVAILDPRQLFDRPLPTALVPEANVGSATIDHVPRAGAPAPQADAEQVTASNEVSERTRMIGAEQVAERRRERAPASSVAYLHVVTPAAPVTSEPTPPPPAERDDGESLPAPTEAILEETIDVEWPAALDTVAEPLPEDAGYELPVLDDASSAADIAPLAAALPEPAPVARADAPAAPARAASNTVRSFERLQDLKRRHTVTGHNRRQWPVALAAVVVVLLLIGAWILIGPELTSTPDATEAQPAAMVQDPAALAVHPASIPSTPAQPPE